MSEDPKRERKARIAAGLGPVPKGGSGPDRKGTGKAWPKEAQFKKRHPRRWLAGLVVLVLLVGVVQLARPIPALSATASVPLHSSLPGGGPTIHWPAVSEVAVAIPGVGSFGPQGPSTPMPIASLTKIMTAMVILKDHPLAPGAPGPAIPVTAADAQNYQSELAQQDSVAAVAAGEVLSEREALQALLLPSADNVAELLARWDAGSIPAFVAKMNAQAAKLHLSHTHYADTSGLAAGSASDAADQLKLAQWAMGNHTFANTVAMPQAILPVAGMVYSVNYDLGRAGIIGVKTGSDPQAGGCYVFASRVNVAGATRTIYGAILGEQRTQSPLVKVLADGLALARSVASSIHQVEVVPKGTVVATVDAPWGQPVQLRTERSIYLVGTAHMAVTEKVTPSSFALESFHQGQRLGTLSVSSGSQVVTAPLVASSALAKPSWLWRLTRG